MDTAVLPSEFQDLEQFVGWGLPTWTERSRRRIDSSMEEIRAFYDAMLPRLKAIVAFLNQWPPEDMPPDVKRLFYMTLALNKIALAVENFGQQRVPYGFGEERFVAVNERPD